MSAKYQLTPNAIMYISVGFTQESTLQVLSVREGIHSSLEMVIYDGLVYAGALYDYSTELRRLQSVGVQEEPYRRVFEEYSMQGEHHILPKQFDIIKATVVLVAKNQPLYFVFYQRLIRDLRVVQVGWVEPLGKEILSLEQYMKRRKFIPFLQLDEEDSRSNQPTKKIKQNQVRLLYQTEEKEGKPEEKQDQKEYSKEEEDLPEINEVQSEKSGERVENQKESKENMGGEEIQQSEVGKQFSKEANKSTDKSNNSAQRSDISSRYAQICRIMPNKQGLSLQESTLNEHEHTKSENVKSEGAIPSKVFQILLDDDCEITEVRNPLKDNKKSNVIDLINEHESLVPTKKSFHNKEKQESQSFMMIEDLYERMYRFRILCRINWISTFTSQKGNQKTKLMLIDQKGDQIMCFLLDKASERFENSKLELTKGRAYIFENGQVEKDQTGALSISIPWSGIHQTRTFLNSFHPDKMMRVGQLENIDSSHFLEKAIKKGTHSLNTPKAYAKELNICGIFTGMKDQPKLYNTYFRVIGIICDPDQQKSVNFGLYVDELVSFPKEGTVISLHNMRASHDDRIYRLQNTKRSYYLIENQNKHKYYMDLIQVYQKESWKLKTYKNLSEIEYVRRTIGQLKDLLGSMIEHDQCYSELDCNIASLYEKKQFFACSVCKHETKPQKGLRTYCYQCKKIEKWIKRFIFSSEVADSTGSIVVTVFSQDIQAFINCTVEEYLNLTGQDRKTLLELSAYQNVVLRVKSERLLGGSSHSVTRAEKGGHKRGLENIKEKSIENKTRYAVPW